MFNLSTSAAALIQLGLIGDDFDGIWNAPVEMVTVPDYMPVMSFESFPGLHTSASVEFTHLGFISNKPYHYRNAPGVSMLARLAWGF